SRRRHTRWPRDWSSDVCSSDLLPERDPPDACGGGGVHAPPGARTGAFPGGRTVRASLAAGPAGVAEHTADRITGRERRLSVPPRSEERRVGKGGRDRRGLVALK